MTDRERLMMAVVEAAQAFRDAMCSPLLTQPEGYLRTARETLDAALRALDAQPPGGTVTLAAWRSLRGSVCFAEIGAPEDVQPIEGWRRLGTVTLPLRTEGGA